MRLNVPPTYTRIAWAMAIALIPLPTQAAPPTSPQLTTEFQTRVRPFLARHCVACHSGELPKGKLRLDSISNDLSDARQGETWRKVAERIRSGQMPPNGKPRPDPAEIEAVAGWVSAAAADAATSQHASNGRVVLRRLNRVEYQNTIRDLLGVEVNLKDQLPQDGSADGFDNAGAALHTSSFLLERYLEAADSALSQAIANRPRPPPLIQKRFHLKESHPVRSTTEKVYRFLDDTVVCFCSSAWHNVSVTGFYPPDGGNYRIRIAASAVQSNGKPVTFRVTAGNSRLTGKSGLIGYFDAPADELKLFEFVQSMEPRTTISILPYGLASAQTVHKVGADTWDGPGLAVHWVEVEGPLHDAWPPESHRRLFGDLPQQNAGIYNFRDRVEVTSSDPPSDATEILRKFARRAFRRRVSDEDIQPYLAIVESRLAAGASFEQAMRAGLKGVLMSPEFLFLREEPGRLDNFALASRLSYFLWSTMPDEELFRLAEQGALANGSVLRQQVERMLADRKSAAFTENFVGQWLGLREIDATEPSHLLYPEFDHMLKVSMLRETELFFEEMLKHDLSVANFVDADFSIINGRLARHYGIPDVEGWEFRRVRLPKEIHRGGVMTMASVLKVTANGTTTSPVMRGAWVLDRILGTPPSPPPEGVSAIDPDIRGAVTIREQLARHRQDESCAACHKQIDPPGFALESFDVIGGWRDNYRVTGSGEVVIVDGRRMPYHKGKKVDPSDVLPDGREFANIDEFKQLLLEDKDQIARSVTTKLLTYATGAAPKAADRMQVDLIVRKIRDNDYGLRTLVHEVVQSDLFQSK